MKVHRLALVIPILVASACGSSSNPPVDASDGSTDKGADGAAGKADTGSGDTGATDTASEAPVDMAATDAPTDVPTDAPTDGAATDGPTDGADAETGSTDGAGDAVDGGTDAGDGGGDAGDAGDARPPKLVSTVLVVDKLPGDGGTDGAADAGTDASDAGTDSLHMPAIDPNLVNPWGLAINPSGPIWVANAGTGTSTVYNSQGAIQPLVVTIPVPTGGTPPSSPTGLVFNPTSGFMADKFVFATENGTIAGWQSGTAAVTRADNATAMASYKGLTIALRNSVPRLYATDFHNGKVDVYDTGYNKITTTGGFADATIPAGYAPFGILADGSSIIVTYAKQDATAKDDVAGVGNGYVDVFDFDGVMTKRLVSKGALNSPWGLAISPSDFGSLSHSLLVGNFGDGKINAYDLSTGAFVAAAIGSSGTPLVIEGLWSLVFGNDTAGEAHNQLFFTAGPSMEDHGVLGRLDFVP